MTSTPTPDHPGYDPAPDQGAVSAFDTPSATVAVKHEDTGAVWDCPADYLPTAIEKGWQPVDADQVAADTPYEGLNANQLKDLIDERNVALPDDAPDEDRLSKAGAKPALIATLLADDARRR